MAQTWQRCRRAGGRGAHTRDMRDVDCLVYILLLKALVLLVELLDGGCLFWKVRVPNDILAAPASTGTPLRGFPL